MEETRMTKLKKMTAVLLSVIMLVCCFSVQASAKSVFDGAVKIDTLETVSGKHTNKSEYYYKIVLPDSGKIKFHCVDYAKSIIEYGDFLYLLDGNGNTIIDTIDAGFKYMLEKEYEINKKGTYYIKIKQRTSDYWFTDFYYTFEPDHTPTISLALNVKVGDELDFSALASNYTGKVTYKTTDSKVAAVDKGKVTCKKAGKAKIRAYMNNGDYTEITLVVKKK